MSGNANIDVFLKAHSGDSIRVDRQGRESEYIQSPAMTTLIFSQPSVMTSLMANTTFHGRGLCARFLYSLPISTVGNRKFESKPIAEVTTEQYFKLINLLLNYKPDEPRVIKLSEKAYAVLKEFAEKIEPMLIDELADIADFAGKFVGSVLRIAGLLYIADSIPLYSVDELTLEEFYMQGAITIGEYFLEHAKAAYQLMGANENTKNAEYILQKIIKNNFSQITKTELVRICRKFKSTEEMAEPLKVLIDYNYIKEVEQEYNGTGRKPENIYLVNPQIL